MLAMQQEAKGGVQQRTITVMEAGHCKSLFKKKKKSIFTCHNQHGAQYNLSF